MQLTTPGFTGRKPVPDSVFQIYKELFSYDRRDLNAQVEWRKQDSGGWVQERIVVDAAYGHERLPIHVFLPRNAAPPYQTVVYFPGSGSAVYKSSKELDRYREFECYLSPIVSNGRAVVYPVYKGMFERQDPAANPLQYSAPVFTREFTEYVIQTVKDFRISLDYLATRYDIDRRKLAFLGYSWGAILGPIVLAVDDRPVAGILVSGGKLGEGRPEGDMTNYLPHVRVPTLMLNGRYETFHNFDTAIRPMFDQLGTPAAQKKLVVFDSDHFIPRNEYIKETLAWLDRYLGRVK